jgi:hypothetical protein
VKEKKTKGEDRAKEGVEDDGGFQNPSGCRELVEGLPISVSTTEVERNYHFIADRAPDRVLGAFAT